MFRLRPCHWTVPALRPLRIAGRYEEWRVPEPEVYESLHVLRRKLVTWLRSAQQRDLDELMDGVVLIITFYLL